MGRYILCGREADTPYEVEELDLRLYSIEELCYLIYRDLMLLSDDFISERLINFIRDELEMSDMAEKIERFYSGPADFDATVLMLLSEVGYYDESELNEFKSRLVLRRRKNGPERTRDRARVLLKKHRYNNALRVYRTLISGPRDGRVGAGFYTEAKEEAANCYGYLSEFDKALNLLEDVYEETSSEKILKKMYDICVLTGREPKEKYFGNVPEETLNKWQMEYWDKESAARLKIDENPLMQIFLHDKEEAIKELQQYVEDTKDIYRGMLE